MSVELLTIGRGLSLRPESMEARASQALHSVADLLHATPQAGRLTKRFTGKIMGRFDGDIIVAGRAGAVESVAVAEPTTTVRSPDGHMVDVRTGELLEEVAQ